MRAILLDAALWGGSVAAFLTLADWLLSGTQKKKFSDYSVRAWSWLDDMRKRRVLLEFRRGRPQLVLAITAQLVAFGMIFYISYQRTLPVVEGYSHESVQFGTMALYSLASILTIYFAAKRILPLLLRWLSRSADNYTYFGRIFVLVLNLFAITTAYRDAARFVSKIWEAAQSASVYILLRVVSVCLATMYFTFISMFALTLLTVLALFLMRVALISLEFVMRRIAEADKGPLVAVSVLISAVAGALKVFGP